MSITGRVNGVTPGCIWGALEPDLMLCTFGLTWRNVHFVETWVAQLHFLCFRGRKKSITEHQRVGCTSLDRGPAVQTFSNLDSSSSSFSTTQNPPPLKIIVQHHAPCADLYPCLKYNFIMLAIMHLAWQHWWSDGLFYLMGLMAPMILMALAGQVGPRKESIQITIGLVHQPH